MGAVIGDEVGEAAVTSFVRRPWTLLKRLVQNGEESVLKQFFCFLVENRLGKKQGDETEDHPQRSWEIRSVGNSVGNG